LVAGVYNKIHIVTPGTGVSLTCNHSRVNHSSGLCEHILAVAQVNNKLEELVAWCKRSKRGPKAVDMALSGGPKNEGKKPSNRKRSNGRS